MNENKRKIHIVLPALCALVLAGGLFWFFGNSSQTANPSASEKKPLTLQLEAGSKVASASVAQNEVKSTHTNSQPPSINETKKIMNATFHTTKGDFTVTFNSDTPNTVANFVKLVQAGFYDGTKFHRVIKGFMNQGGDPLSKDDSQVARWGTGGPGYQFADEIGPNNHNDLGTIAMANAGANTNGSQFFVNVANNNSLDQKHTVFGKVISGLDVVMKINSVQTGERDRPLEPIVLKSVMLQ